MIVQLSDLHIRPKDEQTVQEIDALARLKAAVEHINHFSPAIEHVIISGDLSHLGTQEGYELAGSCLEALKVPMSMVPGNHDDRASMRNNLGHLTQFADEHYNTFYLKREDSVWIGLDSLVEGQHYGFIEREQLDWLDSKLQQEPDLPHIVCWHHPPMRVGITHMDKNNLHNADEVAEVLAPYSQIQGIMCGHVHRPISSIWHGKLVWVTPAITNAVALNLTENAPAGFAIEPLCLRLYEFYDGRIVSHISYIDEASDGPHSFA